MVGAELSLKGMLVFPEKKAFVCAKLSTFCETQIISGFSWVEILHLFFFLTCELKLCKNNPPMIVFKKKASQ